MYIFYILKYCIDTFQLEAYFNYIADGVEAGTHAALTGRGRDLRSTFGIMIYL